jgi:hypothetical protein
MPWDPELEQLTDAVRTIFGEEEFQAAGRRALAAMKVSDLAVVQEERDDTIEGPDGEVYDIEPFHEALRRELRRLVQPQ